MGQFLQGRGKWSKCGIFLKTNLELFCDQTVCLLTFLNCSEEILPGHSKNVFVLVLAHLEPELELLHSADQAAIVTSKPTEVSGKVRTVSL